MSAISTILTRLRAAIWAIDVRDDIANAIEQCYSDVSNPTLQTEALEAALQEKIDQGEMAALTIGDHTITAVKLANGVIPAADATLTETGKPADAAETGRQIGLLKADLDTLEEALENVDGLSNDVKTALLACFDHVAWNGTSGQSYYDALENALYPSGLPSGYTRYDYITYDYSLGTRLTNTIVTDIAMSSDYILDTEFSFTNDGSGEAKNTECIMGSRLGNGGFKQFALFANRTTMKCGYWYDGVDTTQVFNYLQGVNHVTVQPVGVSEIYPSNATIKINGTEYDTGATATGVTWSPWLGFFGYGEAANYTESPSNKFQLKLGRTIIKNLNRKTLYDFIPVHNGTSYGLYERINKKFYMGQEPSHFTCGNWS